MRIRLAVPDELDDQDRKAALDAALESVVRSSTPMIKAGKWPTAADSIRAGKVEWKPEPPGDEHFDLAPVVLRRGNGDCDDLAPWHASSLRASGVDPGARAIVRKSGEKRWHAIVQRSDGSIEDPSKAAGMGTNGHGVNGPGGHDVVGAYAPIQPPMSADGRMCLCISPGKNPSQPDVWFARCDVPDRLQPWDWSSMAASHHPAKALLHAVKGCRTVAGGDMDFHDQARLGALHDLILGASAEQVAEHLHAIMGDLVDADIVVGEAAQSVGFFKSLFKAVASPITSAVKFAKHPSLKNFGGMFTAPISAHLKAAQPLAKMAKPFSGLVRFVPGIGPMAATAVDFLAHPPANFKEGLKFAAAQGAGFIPGVGPLATQLIARGIPGLPGMMGPVVKALQAGQAQQQNAQRFIQAASQPNMQYDPGKLARPWGPNGPAVMRF